MTASNSKIKKEVIRKLKEEYGDSLLDFQQCKKLYDKLTSEKIQIESQLNLSNEESQLSQVVRESESKLNECSELLSNSTKCVDKITTDLEAVNEVRKKVQGMLQELHSLQCALQYFKVIQRIEFLNDELAREFSKKDDEQCTTIFVNVCEISRNLIDFPGTHLKNHLQDTLLYWHGVLKTKLSKDFEDILKAIKWPFVNANFNLIIPSQANIKKLQIVTEYALQIELPSETSGPVVSSSAILSDFPPLSLPMQFLISPLRKRFLYHFYGTRQTNRSDKPEWYLTQVLTWIRDHQDFVEKWIQSVIDKLGLHHIDAKLELARGLIQLAVEKLYSDLPKIQYNDVTFSHSVDEALGFDKELRETYCYPSSQPSILIVLTQAQVFIKWLNMEKKYAVEKMDVILPPSSTDAFDPLASDIEDLKVTVCADSFITLLQTITDRYEALPQPGHRLQFLELQLELLDDFRVRLVQLAHAEQGDVVESKIPMIANTLHYIENVLNDWGATLHYLNLYYYKSQLNTIEPVGSNFSDFDDVITNELEADSVFNETLSLYGHLRKELLSTLSDSVIQEIKEKGNKYCNEWWSAMSVPQKDFKSYSLTQSACPMFEILAKRLHQLQKTLANKLYSFVWKSIAKQIDTYLFEELVLDNKFNEGGAMQLKYDIMRNLIPLFSQYTEKPEYYFTQLVESCSLLTVSKGSALLLRETLIALEGATGVEDTRGRALREIGIKDFTPKMAVKLLNRRTDITTNRIIVD